MDFCELFFFQKMSHLKMHTPNYILYYQVNHNQQWGQKYATTKLFNISRTIH